MVYFTLKEIMEILQEQEEEYFSLYESKQAIVDKKFGRHGILATRQLRKIILEKARQKYDGN